MLSRSPDLLLSSYDFALPPALIAQEPCSVRDGSRLLVASCAEPGPPRDALIADLPDLLEPGDLLVVNDTRVLPARLTARRATGGAVRLLALHPTEGGWACLVKPSARITVGERITVERRADGERGPTIVIGPPTGDGAREVSWDEGDLAALMQDWGEMPLPPYITREDGPRASDRDRYQTVFAAQDGAVAAPTAGLHFTPELIARLAERGITTAAVTLHVGAGTFAPVRVDDLLAHTMHSERYAVPPATASVIEETLAAGRRVVCVGTTSARALESWHRAGRPTDGAVRSTRLFLRPGDPPEVRFSLLTNFHLPRSTLLVLVASLLGRERALSIYEHAVHSRYRFFSYGDACLFL